MVAQVVPERGLTLSRDLEDVEIVISAVGLDGEQADVAQTECIGSAVCAGNRSKDRIEEADRQLRELVEPEIKRFDQPIAVDRWACIAVRRRPIVVSIGQEEIEPRRLARSEKLEQQARGKRRIDDAD